MDPFPYIRDPKCWFCEDGAAVQQDPPLCRECRFYARRRLKDFLLSCHRANRLRDAGRLYDPPASAQASQ